MIQQQNNPKLFDDEYEWDDGFDWRDGLNIPINARAKAWLAAHPEYKQDVSTNLAPIGPAVPQFHMAVCNHLRIDNHFSGAKTDGEGFYAWFPAQKAKELWDNGSWRKEAPVPHYRKELHKALSKLRSNRVRTAFIEHVINNRPQTEIARELGTTQGFISHCKTPGMKVICWHFAWLETDLTACHAAIETYQANKHVIHQQEAIRQRLHAVLDSWIETGSQSHNTCNFTQPTFSNYLRTLKAILAPVVGYDRMPVLFPAGNPVGQDELETGVRKTYHGGRKTGIHNGKPAIPVWIKATAIGIAKDEHKSTHADRKGVTPKPRKRRSTKNATH
jgi:hypothetical protein